MMVGLGVVLVLALGMASAIWYVVVVPGSSYRGELPALTAEQETIAGNLRRHIEKLAAEIGPRSSHDVQRYADARDYLTTTLEAMGYRTELMNHTPMMDHIMGNVVAELRGNARPEEIVIVGAHYDTLPEVPGANDNGSGVAGTLELARMFAGKAQAQARTLRFVLFFNEESVSPWGAEEYAKQCRAKNEKIVGMFSLETIGYYTDEPDTQKYPWPLSLFYPSTGNFVAFVGSVDYRGFLHKSAAAFRDHAKFPSRGIAAPGFLKDATRSDHAPFWTQGYPAVMITDTANFRYRDYHEPTDTAEKVKYEHLARVVDGLRSMLMELSK
jgi:hypothetical protein